MSETQPVTVIFDFWGQRSATIFDVTSELDPITWLQRCAERGFLIPIEIVNLDGVVLYGEDELRELCNKF